MGFRRILTVALGDLLVLALLLAAGEAAVRLLYPQASRHLFTPTVTGGHPITCNSHGLRDEEFPAAKPAGERRVLCLGDSTTFGAGIQAEDTYPKQLQRVLNVGTPAGRWRVINAGGQGASVSQLIRFLEERGLAFSPDAVTLGFSPTMVSVAGRGAGTPGGQADGPAPGVDIGRGLRGRLLHFHARLHSSYLYVFLDANLRRRLYRWEVIRDRMDAREGALFAYAFDVPGVDKKEVELAYAALEAELARCRDLLAGKRVPLVVMGLPSRFRISAEPGDNERGYDLSKIRIEPMDRAAEICRRLGIPFVDLQPRLAEERAAMEECYIPGDYAHLNAVGMRFAAEELADALQGELGLQ